jgi:hypothetical protein
MKKTNNENLEELLAKFMPAREASKAAEDIAAGERILDSHTAPKPSNALLRDITLRMAAAKKHRQTRLRWEFATTAAAAVIVVCAGVFLMYERGEITPYTQTSELFWQETLDNKIDTQIVQIDQPENDIPLITFEAGSNSEPAAITIVTDELNEIGETFWEG